MKKLFAAFLLIWLAIMASLIVQNLKLRKQLNELRGQNKQALDKLNELQSEPKPANPEGASPFDKPNVDPLADKFAPTSPGVKPSTSILFERMVHDFGRIDQGVVVNTTFKFTNTGKYVLLIYHAQATCGCTVPQWPRDPIKPGETGEIKVQFDSHDKEGQVMKTINISSNAVTPIVSLTIRATVIPKVN